MSEIIRPLRVLIVDDDSAVRGALRRTLGPRYETTLVENAEDALVALEQDQFDVVISDTDLGEGMWGPKFLAEVAKRWPGVGRVITSGANQEVAQATLVSGVAHEFVGKPWNVAEPVQAIAAAMAKAADETAARRA